MKSKKALIVLDLQEICVGKKHAIFFKYDKDIIENANKIIKANDNVIYVRTLLMDNLFFKMLPIRVNEGSKNAELVEGLLIKKGSVVFNKNWPDAFSNPKLLEYIHSNRIDTLELIGVDGGGCVVAAARSALKNGLRVIINTKAIDTMFKRRQAKMFKRLEEMGAEFINY